MSRPGTTTETIDFGTRTTFEGFDVVWVGPNPFHDGFAFGSEDGKLLFTNEDIQPVVEAYRATASGEAINGLAYSGGVLAVSTRSDTTFWCLPLHQDEPGSCVTTPAGAHGIVAMADGHFVAPMGHSGLLVMKAMVGDKIPVGVSKATEQVCFYRVAILQDPHGIEVLAFALRRAGLGFETFNGEAENTRLNTTTFDQLDVVDVCAMEPKGLSIAAVGLDGTLVLIRNALDLDDMGPVTMRFPAVEGVAYRLLSSRGHIILVTSKATYVFVDLAKKFLAGGSVPIAPPTLVMPMEPIDACVYRDKLLLVVTADNAVLRFDLEMIGEGVPRKSTGSELKLLQPTRFQPDWRQLGVNRGLREMVST